MPRKPSAKKSTPHKRQSEIRKNIREELGEESASDVDFQSPSSNSDTNYGLDYTGHTVRSPQKIAKGKNRNVTPTRQSDISHRAGTSGIKKNTRMLSNPVPGSSQMHSSPSADRSRRAHTSSQVQAARRRSSRVQENERSIPVSESRPRPQVSESRPRPQVSESRPKPQVSHSRRKNRTPKKRNHVLQEIRRLQDTTRLCVPKLPFSRVIKESLAEFGHGDMRVQYKALELLQEATEAYLVQLLADANLCTRHRDRITLMVKDIELVRILRGPADPGNF